MGETSANYIVFTADVSATALNFSLNLDIQLRRR